MFRGLQCVCLAERRSGHALKALDSRSQAPASATIAARLPVLLGAFSAAPVHTTSDEISRKATRGILTFVVPEDSELLENVMVPSGLGAGYPLGSGTAAARPAGGKKDAVYDNASVCSTEFGATLDTTTEDPADGFICDDEAIALAKRSREAVLAQRNRRAARQPFLSSATKL